MRGLGSRTALEENIMAEWYPGKFIEKIREKRILKGLASPPVLVGGEWVDAEIDRLMEEKKSEWRARGYSESLIRMAESLCNDWARSMAEAFAPSELRVSVFKHLYPKALATADKWITTIAEATKTSKSLLI